MSKGYGIEINDWILAGAVAFLAYSAHKTIVKPVSDITNSVSDLITLKNVPSSSELLNTTLFYVPDKMQEQSENFMSGIFNRIREWW